MAALAAASWPPTSAVGSRSANPKRWASANAWVYERLFSDIVVRMKFVVPLTIPITSRMRSPANDSRRGRMSGMAPATAASKSRSTPDALAMSASAPPWEAMSSLLPVTTGFLAARAASMRPRAGSMPPMSSTTTSTAGSSTKALASPVSKWAGISGRTRAGSPTATPARVRRTPERAAMPAASDRRSETKAPPTLPAPSTATLTAGTSPEVPLPIDLRYRREARKNVLAPSRPLIAIVMRTWHPGVRAEVEQRSQ